MSAGTTAGVRKIPEDYPVWSPLPDDIVLKVKKKVGSNNSGFLALYIMEQTAKGYRVNGQPAPFCVPRQRLIEDFDETPQGFEKTVRALNEVLDEELNPWRIERDRETDTYRGAFDYRRVQNLGKAPDIGKRTIAKKEEREAGQLKQYVKLAAKFGCLTCGSQNVTVELKCNDCGAQNPLGEIYKAEDGTVTNILPADAAIQPETPPEPTPDAPTLDLPKTEPPAERELARAVGQTRPAVEHSPAPLPRAVEIPVSAVLVQPIENTRGHSSGNGATSEIPETPAPTIGFLAFVSSLLAAFGTVFLEKAGKPLDIEFARRIARVLGHHELIPDLVAEVGTFDHQKLRGGRSGIVLKVAQDLRAGYEARQRLGVTDNHTGRPTNSAKAFEKYQRYMERHKKGAPNDA